LKLQSSKRAYVVFYAWLDAAEPERWPVDRAALRSYGALALTVLFLGLFIYCVVSLINDANKKYRGMLKPHMRTISMMLGICLSFFEIAIAQNAIPKACEESWEAFKENCGKKMEGLHSHFIEKSKNAPCAASLQCKTVGVGAKLCGGPGAYIPYSTAVANVQDFLNEANEFNKLSRLGAKLMSRDLGLLSDCALVSDPGAVCLANRCVLNTR